MTEHQARTMPQNTPDLREKGVDTEGNPQFTERRLFVQLHVFDQCKDPSALVSALAKLSVPAVLYLDVQNPFGVGVLLMSECADELVTSARNTFHQPEFSSLTYLPSWTMTGRTYATGHEVGVEHWLIERPKKTALNPELKWAVWYPLRRKPEFALLTPQEQGKILYEHAVLGRSFGQAGYATDIRLACYGIDRADNEFVLGIVSKDLNPLSRLVQEMRKTQQTSKFIQSMGPFFVGRVFWQSSLPA